MMPRGRRFGRPLLAPGRGALHRVRERGGTGAIGPRREPEIGGCRALPRRMHVGTMPGDTDRVFRGLDGEPRLIALVTQV